MTYFQYEGERGLYWTCEQCGARLLSDYSVGLLPGEFLPRGACCAVCGRRPDEPESAVDYDGGRAGETIREFIDPAGLGFTVPVG